MTNYKINKNEISLFNDFLANLEKLAVQPVTKDKSIFHQINDIMNGGAKSKFSSVSEVVEDMKARSGLTAYLEKISNKEDLNSKISIAEDLFFNKINLIKNTIQNIITSTKGGLSVPAILEKLKNIHYDDPNIDNNFWQDPRLNDIIAKLNLKEKSQYPELNNNQNIGKITSVNENNQWDNDYFYGINA